MTGAPSSFQNSMAALLSKEAVNPAGDASTPAWLKHSRAQAAERFLEAGVPTRDWESWKYFDLAFLNSQTWSLPANKGTASKNASDASASSDLDLASLQLKAVQKFLPSTETPALVFLDGGYLGSVGVWPQGPAFGSFAALLGDQPDKAKWLLDQVTNKELWTSKTPQPFLSLNEALYSDGAYLNFPKGVTVEETIFLVHLQDPTDSTLQTPRTLLNFEEASQGAIVELYLGSSALLGETPTQGAQFPLSNSVSLINIGARARVHWTALHLNAASTISLTSTKVATEGSFDGTLLSLGSEQLRANVEVSLTGEQAETHLAGMFIAAKKACNDFHTDIRHLVPKTTSRELIKCVVGGTSRGIFNGTITVAPQAQQASSRLLNKNLLLSSGAEMDTKPELFIYADDVKASHGATVGQLNPEELFYLQSRAIDPQAAISLVTEGFAQEVVGRISTASTREWVARKVATTLASAQESL